jgi:hypothetical protein
VTLIDSKGAADYGAMTCANADAIAHELGRPAHSLLAERVE